MLTKNFLELLEQNPGKELIFEYQDQLHIPKAYHITEVKNVHIDAVDCGGRPSEYYQTIVQLWVSGTEQADRHMLTEKALKIFNTVERIKPIRKETPIFFEWGHGDLATSVYEIEAVSEAEHSIKIKMTVPPTVCKPIFELELQEQNGNGNCGPGSGCC